MEHRVTITIGEHGADEANVERVLDAFLKVHPEVGPVVDANLEEGTLSVTFSLDVDQDDFTRAVTKVFIDGMNKSGLAVTRAIHADVSAIGAAAELERDLQPA